MLYWLKWLCGFFIVVAIFPSKYLVLLNRLVVFFFLVLFIGSLMFWLRFDGGLPAWQGVVCWKWLVSYPVCFGVDAVSLLLVVLTTFLTPFCLVAGLESLQNNVKFFLCLFILLYTFVLLALLVLDVLFFYIFFEAVLIPMFLIIGLWGSSERRGLAATYFFFFTLAGSVLMLVGLLVLFGEAASLDYAYLQLIDLPQERQLFYWPLFFIPFAVKIPMFPFHIWLPEAHVEAPTGGSMFLAAILLKLGAYGFLRILLPFFPLGCLYYQPVVFTLGVVSVFYTSIIALRQLDIKRVVAYSSIAHMNFAVLGLFSRTCDGFSGSVVVFIGHGFVSCALFFLVGVLYDRYKTRSIFYYGGLVQRMPLFSIVFFFFSLANAAFPGTVNFVGELFILIGLGRVNLFIFFMGGLSLFFSTVFTFWLYNRLCFGTPRVASLPVVYDLTWLEGGVLMVLGMGVLLGGLFPGVFYNGGFVYYQTFIMGHVGAILNWL